MRPSRRRSGDRPLPPPPALRGERVGVRGSFGKLNSWRVPLTPRSPDDALHRRESADLSPQAGRGDRIRASADSTKSHHALESNQAFSDPLIALSIDRKKRAGLRISEEQRIGDAGGIESPA